MRSTRKNNSHGNESRASSDASGGASDQAYELPPVGKDHRLTI